MRRSRDVSWKSLVNDLEPIHVNELLVTLALETEASV